MFVSVNLVPPRVAAEDFEQYLELCLDVNIPALFVAVNNNDSIVKRKGFYKNTRLGRNTIAAFLKTCAASAGLNIPGLHPHSL